MFGALRQIIVDEAASALIRFSWYRETGWAGSLGAGRALQVCIQFARVELGRALKGQE